MKQETAETILSTRLTLARRLGVWKAQATCGEVKIAGTGATSRLALLSLNAYGCATNPNPTQITPSKYGYRWEGPHL